MKYQPSASSVHKPMCPPFFFPHSLFLIFLVLLLDSCARQGAPAGGAKDTQPPEIDTLASTPNFSTRFDGKRIELKFDEWVVLSDVITQIVVSPPLAKRPEVVLKGKTVVVDFDKAEELRSNTTYTINFGNSVKDLHEGNAAKDLRFVFSTGDFIDSLGFKGTITDAFSGDPVENVSVMMYENLSDTAIYKERPYYFSRTDKAGQYEFKNLRSGTFRVVAVEDTDVNLKWNGESERFAFLDTTLQIRDSMLSPIALKLFKNQAKYRLINQNASRYGLIKVGFSVPLQSFETQNTAPEGLKTLLEKNRDSLMLWYDLPTVDTSWSLLFSAPEFPMLDSAGQAKGPRFDTIEVKKLLRSDFLKNHRVAFGDVALPAAPPAARGKSLTPAAAPAVKPPAVKTVVQSPGLPANLPFNFPITAFDTAKWLLTVDTNRLTAFNVMSDTSSPRRLVFSHDWKQGKAYTVILLPGAITDFWGVSNTDTLSRIFNVLTDKQLGSMSLTLEKLKPGSNYVLQLLNGNALEAERTFFAESSSKKLTFSYLQVAGYSARLVEDRNGNGRWDTGDFKAKRQPEPIFNKKIDPLRANWELEVTFSAEVVNEKKRKQ